MIAVKWRTDFEFWPERTRSNVNSLPEGFDIVMSQEDYDLHISSHEQDFFDWEDVQAANNATANGASKFKRIREKWTELADAFAFENSTLGISAIPGKTKEVADAFDRVVYYLNANAPTEAIKELDLIPRGDVFLTEERITTLKNQFIAFLSSL